MWNDEKSQYTSCVRVECSSLFTLQSCQTEPWSPVDKPSSELLCIAEGTSSEVSNSDVPTDYHLTESDTESIKVELPYIRDCNSVSLPIIEPTIFSLAGPDISSENGKLNMKY